MSTSGAIRETRLTHLWLLGSVAHTCPWSPHYRSGSLCLGEEQDSAEQVPQLTARRSEAVGKHKVTRRGRNVGLHEEQVEGPLLPSDRTRQERARAGSAGRGTEVTAHSSTVRPAGLGETSSQRRHLLPETEEGNREWSDPSLKYLPSLQLLAA